MSPILNDYVKNKQALLFEHRTRKNMFSPSPKVRRGDELVKKLVEMIGRNIDLYDMMLQFLRTLYLKTRNVQYCTLRYSNVCIWEEISLVRGSEEEERGGHR